MGALLWAFVEQWLLLAAGTLQGIFSEVSLIGRGGIHEAV